MSQSHRVYGLVILIGALLLGACNFPLSATPPTPTPDLVRTAAAQTVEAQLTLAAVGQISTMTPPPPTSTQPGASPAPSSTAPPTGVTSTPSPQPSPSMTTVPCNRAGFVRDVTVPDGTDFAPGATFEKTWRLENTGACTWDSSYSLVFVDGDAMGGPAASALTAGTVPPGGEIDVTVQLTAPESPGSYRGNWKLRNPAGVLFGLGSDGDREFWVEIDVIEPTATPNPAFTLTYQETHLCGGNSTAIFGVSNTGNAAFESAQVTVINLSTTATLFGPASSNAPFLNTVGECPPGGEDIRAGRTRYLGADLGETPPSNDQARATVRVCTLDDLQGACVEKTVDFTIP